MRWVIPAVFILSIASASFAAEKWPEESQYIQRALKKVTLTPAVQAKFDDFVAKYPNWYADGRLSFSGKMILESDPAMAEAMKAAKAAQDKREDSEISRLLKRHPPSPAVQAEFDTFVQQRPDWEKDGRLKQYGLNILKQDPALKQALEKGTPQRAAGPRMRPQSEPWRASYDQPENPKYIERVLKKVPPNPEVQAEFDKYVASRPDWLNDGRLKQHGLSILKRDPAVAKELEKAEARQRANAGDPDKFYRSSATANCMRRSLDWE